VIVAQHPDGRLLGWVPQSPVFWLDLEAENPFDGVRKFAFIVGDEELLRRPTFQRVDWSEVPEGPFAAPIFTYDDVLKPPAGFARYFAQRRREELRARRRLRTRKRRAP
jgi:hypothetical protein